MEPDCFKVHIQHTHTRTHTNCTRKRELLRGGRALQLHKHTDTLDLLFFFFSLYKFIFPFPGTTQHQPHQHTRHAPDTQSGWILHTLTLALSLSHTHGSQRSLSSSLSSSLGIYTVIYLLTRWEAFLAFGCVVFISFVLLLYNSFTFFIAPACDGNFEA